MTRTLRSTLLFIGAAALMLSSACSSSSSPTLSSIAVAPAAASVAIGHTQALTATGTFSDGSTAAVTDAIWTTSSATVATVSTSGLVTARAAGSATITATSSGHSGSAVITVPAPALSSIAATAASATLAIGGTDQITVTGTYDDGSHQNLSASATYTPTPATGVVTVSAGGLISGVAAGSASIAVAAGGKTAPTPVSVTVSAPVLASLALTPGSVHLAASGATQQLVVTGTYDVGPTHDVTASATFTINPATGVATVSSGGLVTAVAETGVASVTATIGSLHASASVIVGNPDLASVFVGGAYATGVAFVPFVDNSVLNAVSIDASTSLTGKSYGSIKVVLPTDTTKFTGGAFVDSIGPRDLSAFDAVTFWAKASEAVTLDLAGLGNDAGPNSGVEAEVHGVALTTAWQQFTIPVPLPSKYTAVDGLFHFAHGATHSTAADEVDVWFSDIEYASLGAGVLGAPSPAWVTQAQSVSTGGTYQITDTDLTVAYTIHATPVTLASINPAYFTLASSSSSATVDASGLVTAVSAGSANITARLGDISVPGQLTITVTQPAGGPTTLPPTPAQTAGASVISLYSSVPGGYNGTASDKSGNVDTWLTCWSQSNNPTAGGNPFSITDGAHTANPRKYVFTAGAGGYAGVELLGKTGATSPGSCGGNITGAHELDISAMDHFHVDIWTPDANNVQVNLVDAGADGTLTGGATNGNVTLNGLASPAFTNGAWLSYDIPLSIGGSSFQNGNWANPPSSLKHLGQLVFTVPNGGTVYFDNIYFYKGGGSSGGSGPTAAAAAPTVDPASARSLFSATYSGTAADYSAKVDSYDSPCEGAGGTVSDFTIPGTTHPVKQYAINANDFAIIELIGATGGTGLPALCNGGTQTGANELDASALDTLHFDVWSANGSGNFQVHLINAGADGYINQGPGATTGQGIGTADFASGANTVGKGAWVSFDVKFSALGAGAGALNRIGMVKFFTTDAGTYFLDNLYFYKSSAAPAAPAAPVADPTVPSANVISLFSGKYAGSPADYSRHVDSYASACFSDAGNSVADYSIGGVHPVKKYSISGGWAVIETIGGAAGADLCGGAAQDAHQEIDVSSMTKLHFDVWSQTGSTNFQVKLVSGDATTGQIPGPGGAGTATEFFTGANQIAAGQWVPFDIPLSSLVISGPGKSINKLGEVRFFSSDAGTFYIDNIYFSQPAVPAFPPAPPDTSTHPSSSVISLYNSSGTYTDQANTVWNTFGNNGVTEADYTIAGTSRVLKEYTALEYVGVDFTAVANATAAMTHLHVDVWTPNGTQFGVKFGASGAGGANQCQIDYTSATVTQNGWVHLDVPLACLPAGANGTINEILWVDNQSGNIEHGTFFIDNVYFWK